MNRNEVENLKNNVKNTLDNTKLYNFKGTVAKLLGLTVDVELPGLKIGNLCCIETDEGHKKSSRSCCI